MSKRFITINEVSQKVSLNKRTIYRMINDNQFPKQIKIGGRSTRWLESDIDNWIDEQIKNSGAA